MSTQEIEELLDLLDWSRTKLAAELNVTESCVHHWLAERRLPRDRHVKKMRRLLADARKLAAAR